MCVCVCETIRPGAAGVGSNPPSRSNRSPPAVFAGLETRPGAGIPTARLDCWFCPESPRRSSRSQTYQKTLLNDFRLDTTARRGFHGSHLRWSRHATWLAGGWGSRLSPGLILTGWLSLTDSPDETPLLCPEVFSITGILSSTAALHHKTTFSPLWSESKSVDHQ